MVDSAQVVVIGGGAIGTSTAYHLARAGISDVVLIDRFALADGTTWHSGGFVGQLRSSIPIMQLIRRSAALYPDLVDGYPALDWHGVGSVRLATTERRMAEFEGLVALAQQAGVPATVISREQLSERWPALNTKDLLGAIWIPTDGYLEPDTLPQAMGAAAQSDGVTIELDRDVTGFVTDSSGVRGVRTSAGVIAARQVVIAAGYATPLLARTIGLFVPIGVSRQQYLVSDVLQHVDLTGLPTVREPDQSQYFRTLGRSILLGAITGESKMVVPDDLPQTRRLVFDPVENGLDDAWTWCRHRVPALADVGVGRVVRGPEGVTADGELIADETPVKGVWVAAAGNGHGIAAAGGVGWYTAERIAHQLDERRLAPDVDGADFAFDRFPASYASDTGQMLAAMESCELAHYHEVDAVDLHR